MSNEARLRRDGAISYLQKSNIEDLDVLLQAIDYALLLPVTTSSLNRHFFRICLARVNHSG